MRKVGFATDEFYHIFNRGVDKRTIFLDQNDVERFFHGMNVFNSVEPIGSVYEHSFRKEKFTTPLVEFVAYNLLSNHFHFIAKQVIDNGISILMRRMIAGYSYYFNNKYGRSGALFQGRFKAIHLDTNEYLLYASAYVNTNHLQTLLGVPSSKLQLKNSFNEYFQQEKSGFCTAKAIILEQFSSIKEYQNYAESVLEEVKANKIRYKLSEE